MRKPDELPESTDVELDSLLRKVAYVSTVALAGSSSRTYRPGHTLLDGRLQIRRRLGEGGMGVVYEAFDEARRAVVALKTLNQLDAQNIYRLKHEFRSLADVRHPGLCHLYELFNDGDWFFTMELVAGQSFDRWVRPRDVLDEGRLRAVIPQLWDAVGAIHQAGKLHRDLKPSNVLVTDEGRLVVLDFGLAVDHAQGGVGRTLHEDGISGTPAYMAPEQAAGDPATPASDLYAVGAMLFEALTGERPFSGRIGELLAAKQRDAAPRVRTLAPAAPADLAVLCDALLARDPAERPARESLPTPRVVPSSIPPRVAPTEREPLLGRDAELRQLQSAYEQTLSGQGVVLAAAGESGMGKSALVGRFLDDLRDQGQAAVLQGRCYERESVPFKAFDTIVDDLSRFLRKQPAEACAALMPREVFALARLFPVLERVPAVAAAPRKEIPDVQELRQRAFAAFGELLGRIRDRRPLVIFVDDLQWTDPDSCVFMEALLALPEPIPLLLIVSHRSEGAGDNVLLQRTLRAALENPRLSCRALTVGPLATSATRALAERMLGPHASEGAAIALEAQGSPFFVGELVRHAHLDDAQRGALSLQEAVMRHVHELAAGARGLLDVLAVAGRPLSLRLALDAAGATHDDADLLRAERLLRAGADRTLECYHDKIREYVSAALSEAQLRNVHAQLAEQLALQPVADPEHLALHFHGAGQDTQAAAQYERAGDVSVRALAFDHASRMYRLSLQLGDASSTPGRRLKLAAALASAGNSREAAEMYRTAGAEATPGQRLEPLRKAAHLLATSGYLDEGRVLMGEVLAAIGLSLPRSRRTAIASALLSRAQLRLRGLRPVTNRTPSPELEARLGALWTVTQGSLGNDPFLMVEMAARYTRLSLDSGSRAHAARALSMEAYLGSFDGPPTRARTERLLDQADALAESVAEPELTAWLLESRGCVLMHEGRFTQARLLLGKAITLLETQCTGVPFELACARGYDMNAANHLGEYVQISERTPTIVENSLRRGDQYQASGVASFAMPAWLSHRGPSYARARFDEAKQRFQPQTNFQWADYLMLVAELNVALYVGEPARGAELVAARWPAVQQSQLLRMQIAEVMLHYCRSGCLLAAARRDASVQLNLVRASVRTLLRSSLPYARAWVHVLEAGLALHAGRTAQAVQALDQAAPVFDANEMRMYAAAARRRLGQLLGGERGAALITASEAAMQVQGVIDYDATTEMLVPGLI